MAFSYTLISESIADWEIAEMMLREQGRFDTAVFAQERAKQWRDYGRPIFGISQGSSELIEYEKICFSRDSNSGL